MFFLVEPPQIVITSDNVTVDAGNTVLFACVGYGTPDPDITWTRGGNQLTNDSRIIIYEKLLTEGGVTYAQSILQLCSAEVTDAGLYSCNMSNMLGNTSSNFELNVTVGGKHTIIYIQQNVESQPKYFTSRIW